MRLSFLAGTVRVFSPARAVLANVEAGLGLSD